MYYIVLDNDKKVIGLNEFYGKDISKLDNLIEVSEQDYNTVKENFSIYMFRYVNGKFVNEGLKIMDAPISNNEIVIDSTKIQEISNNINLLIELQADILGGAI